MASKKKNLGGRPTKYDDELCGKIIELMATGLSLTAAAADLNIHRETAYAWERDGNHPEFADALKLARGKRVLKLERDLLAAPDGPTVTSRIFALKNADAHEWRDKVEQEITGKDGVPLQTGPTIIFTGAPANSSPPQAVGGAVKPGD